MRSRLKIVAMLGMVLTSPVDLDRRALAGAQAAWQPAAPQGGTASGPRYIYGPGYYGYGYYYYGYPGPATVPQPVPTIPSYRGTPWTYGGRGSTSGYTVGPGHRDWTAGRDLPLAKPWLRPMD